MTDRIPGAPGRCKAVVTGEDLRKLQAGEEFAITLRRDDQPIKEGTPYSKAAVLPDVLAEQLCPEVGDPAPKDAFASLHTQKADTVRQATGKVLTLRDAADTPLMDLKIYGGYDEDGGVVGEKGDITVMVAGKNLFDKDAVEKGYIDFANGNFVENPNYRASDWIPVSGNYITITTPQDSAMWGAFYDENKEFVSGYNGYGLGYSNPDPTKPIPTNAKYTRLTTTEQFLDVFQLELGRVATPYEPHKPTQNIVVPTPSGLGADGSVRDEIDFSKGVLIRRVSENREYPLSEETLEAYASLHTFSSTTMIANDAGADMAVTYYTHTTAVQMVQGIANKGKTFTIDDHGCVTLTRDNPVIACGETTLNGVTWYYRKWADGFAECWAYVWHEYETTEGVTSQFAVILPFQMYFDVGRPFVHLRLSNNAYSYVDVGDVADGGELQINISVTVPESALVDEVISYTGDIYVCGYWT